MLCSNIARVTFWIILIYRLGPMVKKGAWHVKKVGLSDLFPSLGCHVSAHVLRQKFSYLVKKFFFCIPYWLIFVIFKEKIEQRISYQKRGKLQCAVSLIFSLWNSYHLLTSLSHKCLWALSCSLYNTLFTMHWVKYLCLCDNAFHFSSTL